MSDVRTFVTFEADFPDDATYTGVGDLVMGGGKEIASAIAEMLAALGLRISEMGPRDYYGWEFDASNDDGSLYVLIQDTGPWLLITKPSKPRLIGRLFGDKRVFPARDVLSKLNAAIRRDGRFSKIKWYTPDEYDRSRDDTLGAVDP